MTIYFVGLTYTNNGKIKYQILPYNLVGTIRVHFKFMDGLKSLIPFLRLCRFTKRGAKKLKRRIEVKCNV